MKNAKLAMKNEKVKMKDEKMDEFRKWVMDNCWQDVRSYDGRTWVVPTAWLTVMILLGSSLKDMGTPWSIGLIIGGILISLALLMVVCKLDAAKHARIDEIKEIVRGSELEDKEKEIITKKLTWSSKDFYERLEPTSCPIKCCWKFCLVRSRVTPFLYGIMTVGILSLLVYLIRLIFIFCKTSQSS